ncbi:HNH endonuclease [Candidatus Poribacteria bacterium]|nr:HNH endonuclease [Candidatus Poribacteria bacterium]
MIHIQKDYAQIPSGLNSEGAEKKREAALREGNQHEFSAHYYAHDSVKEKLREIYWDKCAYCESRMSVGASWRVEHYRPKNKLKDDERHTGYYWLAYEWSNLLLSCEICNSKKSNQFPIQGTRVERPQEDRAEWRADSESFKAEKPLILNPELDQPEEHLVFLPNGYIKEKDGSERGRKTIEICDLNREDLRIARKDWVDRFSDDIRDQVKIILELQEAGELQTLNRVVYVLELAFGTLFENLMDMKNPEREYSRLGWHMVNDFKRFFVDNLPEGEPREIVTVAFELFRTEWV